MWLSRPFTFVWGPLEWSAILAALALFAAGVVAGMVAERHEESRLAAFGRWIYGKLDRWLQSGRWSFGSLVLLIVLVNGSAMLLITFAVHVPPLSLLLIVVTGLNTGVMAERAAGRYAWFALLMPHAWIELPAVIAGSAAALEATAARMGYGWFDIVADTVWAKAFYIKAVLPLLIGAAIIEALFMVMHARSQSGEEESDILDDR
jgi:hypothetical protein